MALQADSDCTNRPGLFGVPLNQQQRPSTMSGQGFARLAQPKTNPWLGAPQKVDPSRGQPQGHMETDCIEDEEAETVLKYAEERLKSFKFWPKFLMPRAAQLASAGFIYTNQGDRVRCFSCKVLLCDWKKSDNPFEEHYRWSKNCEFLKVCHIPDIQDLSVNQSKPRFGYICR
jgi:hypothetical protein